MTRARIAASAVLALAAWMLPAPAGAASEVSIQGVRFEPHDIEVRAGSTVTWAHRDSGLFHHVAADDGSFDSHPTCGRPGGRCMKGGDTWSRPFLVAGTYGYHCRLHGSPGQGMVGNVVVRR